MSKLDFDAIAEAFSKPVIYVEKCAKFHNVTSLPKVRFAGDGYDAFFSDLTALYSEEPSRTKQEFTAECDINNIMARFLATGGDMSALPLTTRKPIYGDLTTMPDSYHAALNYVKDTEHSFMQLDASLRARFDNNPQLFLDFVLNPDNSSELVKLGLATALPVGTPPDTSKAVGDPTGKVSKKPSVSSSNEDSGGN